MKKSIYRIALTLTVGVFFSQSVQAHFPWLVRESDGRVSYYFGEGLNDRNYKLPPSLKEAKIMRLLANESPEVIEMAPVEVESFVGLRSNAKVGADSTIFSQATFGIYQSARLDYYAFHIGGKLEKSRNSQNASKTELKLRVELVDTDQGVDCYVTWQGQPLKEVDVHLYCSEGHEEAVRKTNDGGVVSFTDNEVEDGLNAVMLGHKVTEAGTWKEKSYEASSHYLTATFLDPESFEQPPAQGKQTSALPKIPVEITSFGAVRCGDSAYIFGGHTGAAHSYSHAAQNDKLYQLDLNRSENGWKELATGPKLQGLGMVAFGKSLILIGGFTAMNQEGEEHDLRSQSTVHAFNTETHQWSKLPELPEPRSSHDAALIDSTVYVVGGWNMQGKENTTWQSTAWSIDLATEKPVWKELSKPPFSRRAIATVAHEGKLFVIGGMNEKGGPTKDVEIYDPATQMWTEGGSLHGDKPMAGFGASGWSLSGKLVVTTFEGTIQYRDASTSSWQVLGKTRNARFFHRMFPLDAQQLVSVGGANMEEGKFAELEVVSIHQTKAE